MSATLRRGDTVTIVAPENDRLHGTRATVFEATAYGFLLDCPAAATGRFRALAGEVVPAGGSAAAAKEAGYTGGCCSQCGGAKLIRNGACELCVECGTSSGCS